MTEGEIEVVESLRYWIRKVYATAALRSCPCCYSNFDHGHDLDCKLVRLVPDLEEPPDYGD